MKNTWGFLIIIIYSALMTLGVIAFVSSQWDKMAYYPTLGGRGTLIVLALAWMALTLYGAFKIDELFD
jgi:hypothetical protein